MSVRHILGNRRNGLRKTGSGTMLIGCCLLFFIWPGFPLLESVLAPQAQAADEQHDDHAGHDHGEHGGHDEYKDDHAGHNHDKDEGSDDHDGHDEHAGHDHEQDNGIRLTPEIIEATGIQVRVAGPGTLGKRIKLIGEISVNENTFAHIVPAAAGVVREVAADIGEHVQAGDVLAILDSREVGEAALEHSHALTAYELSVADFERQEMITTNTHKMLEILSREDDPQTVAELVSGLKIGAAKADVLDALATRYLAQVSVAMAEKLFNYQQPIYDNTVKMLGLLESNSTAAEAQKKLAHLDIGEAKKEIIEALADVELARANFKRQEQLLQQEVGSAKAMQEARHDLDAALSTHDALFEQVRLNAEQVQLKAQREYLTAKQEEIAATTSYPALLEQVVFDADVALLNARQTHRLAEQQLKIAVDKLRVLGLSHDAVQKLAGSDQPITYLPVTAPFDGTITAKHISRGEWLGEDADAFTIADLRTVWVNLRLTQKDLRYVHLDQPVRVAARHVDATAAGKVTYLSPTIDKSTRTILARLEIDNASGDWRPGLFVVAEVDTGNAPAAVLVPKNAVQILEEQSVVFIANGQSFTPRPVTTGRSDKNYVELLSGLSPGQRYVAEGAFQLKAKITISGLGAHAGHGH